MIWEAMIHLTLMVEWAVILKAILILMRFSRCSSKVQVEVVECPQEWEDSQEECFPSVEMTSLEEAQEADQALKVISEEWAEWVEWEAWVVSQVSHLCKAACQVECLEVEGAEVRDNEKRNFLERKNVDLRIKTRIALIYVKCTRG